MIFVILIIILVVTTNLAELVATLLGVSDFWWAYNPQIYWITCGVMFGIYAISKSAKAPAIGMSLITIFVVLLADYFIESVINFIRYPYQDWKAMLAFAAVFLLIPSLVCSLGSFLTVIAIKHLLSRG